jgi:hypothetical protein
MVSFVTFTGEQRKELEPRKRQPQFSGGLSIDDFCHFVIVCLE